jgi:hypothetical protein
VPDANVRSLTFIQIKPRTMSPLAASRRSSVCGRLAVIVAEQALIKPGTRLVKACCSNWIPFYKGTVNTSAVLT